jgi:polyferredoxin
MYVFAVELNCVLLSAVSVCGVWCLVVCFFMFFTKKYENSSDSRQTETKRRQKTAEQLLL